MKEHKMVDNKFIWEEPSSRKSIFGGTVHSRKTELRSPVLWLARDGGELYLVNSSTETLDVVSADSGGFQTVDDDVVSITSNDGYTYKNVKPSFAIKIEEYDEYYDLDYILQVVVTIQSKNLGTIEILTLPAKGGVGETVILWDNGEAGKNVSISSE